MMIALPALMKIAYRKEESVRKQTEENINEGIT